MKNIWFTVYTSTKDDDKYIGIADYRTLLELLLVPAIQDKINQDKKAQKIIISLSDEDYIEHFKKLYQNKKPWQGIINL